MQFNHINTDHLILREISQSVMDFVYGNYSDSGLAQFFGYNYDQLKVERAKHEKGFSTFNQTFLYFQLIDKESEKIIGWCGYHTWYLDHARAEIGYGITDVKFRQKGLMSEALVAIIPYGFNELKLNRIEAMAAEYIKETGNKKPVVGFIAGQTAPPGRRMGHAGAIIGGAEDTAEAKMKIMDECGIHVVKSPADIGETMARVLNA
jgi:ribosomal-protein-alanine N-acetyltransferase